MRGAIQRGVRSPLEEASLRKSMIRTHNEGVTMSITDPDIVQYLQRIAELKSDGALKELEDYARARVIPIIQKEASDVLLYFIRTEQPARILEIGTAIGYSAILMARENDRIQLQTIERDAAMRTLAEANFRKFGLRDRIRILPGEAQDVLTGLAQGHDPYDLIFMDAGKSHYSTYLRLAMDLIAPGGLIICDNVLVRGLVAREEVQRKHSTAVLNMRRFIEEVALDERFDSMLLPVGDGLLIMKIKSKQEN